MTDNKYIVTGGAGFIGSNIVLELNRRGAEDIIIVDNLNSEAKKKNLEGLKYKTFASKEEFRKDFIQGKTPAVSAVFHMGACSSTTETDEEYLKDNNYRYTRQLCEWATSQNARFIYASSAATYGDGANGYSDDQALIPTLKPMNPYGESKQMFDMWALDNGMLSKIAGIKFFNVYGPHEEHKGDMRSVVNKAYKQIKDTGEIRLFKSYKPEYRDGEQTRDFVYVKDAVNVCMFFHDNPSISGIYNCGTGRARTWTDLAKSVFTAMNIKPRIIFIDMPTEIRDMYQYHTEADMKKLRSAGYGEEFTSIEDGAAAYIKNCLAKQ